MNDVSPEAKPPEIKVSKDPKTQAKVEEKREEIQRIDPSITIETANKLARKYEAKDIRIDRLRGKTSIDPLTEIYRKEVILERLRESIAHTKRTEEALSVAFLDLDEFKKFNDTHGHQAGDHMLKAWGRFLKKELRESDMVGRYGGEEVLIVLPNTDEDGARTLIERLRENMPNAVKNAIKELGLDPDTTMTMSIGLAQWRPEETSEDIIKRTDMHMFSAKLLGKDQVVGTKDQETCEKSIVAEHLRREGLLDT